jgi:uncharacterized protein YjiS (DUF1127 family)
MTEQTTPDERFGIDPSNRKTLTPASLWSFEFQRAGARRHVWRAMGAIRSAWMCHLRHRRRQRDLRQLAAMNDFELKDIGLSRDQIRAALWEGTDLRSARR